MRYIAADCATTGQLKGPANGLPTLGFSACSQPRPAILTPVVLATRLTHRRGEAPPQRKEFWARWSTRLVVTVCVIAALIGLALITDPGPEAWYTKMGELIEAVISKAHPGPVVGR